MHEVVHCEKKSLTTADVDDGGAGLNVVRVESFGPHDVQFTISRSEMDIFQHGFLRCHLITEESTVVSCALLEVKVKEVRVELEIDWNSSTRHENNLFHETRSRYLY